MALFATRRTPHSGIALKIAVWRDKTVSFALCAKDPTLSHQHRCHVILKRVLQLTFQEEPCDYRLYHLPELKGHIPEVANKCLFEWKRKHWLRTVQRGLKGSPALSSPKGSNNVPLLLTQTERGRWNIRIHRTASYIRMLLGCCMICVVLSLRSRRIMLRMFQKIWRIW